MHGRSICVAPPKTIDAAFFEGDKIDVDIDIDRGNLDH
jgi:hypothetical protein